MTVNNDAAPTAKTNCVIGMESVGIALMATMALTVVKPVLIIVVMGVIEVEHVTDVKLNIGGILVIIPVQSTVHVMVSVNEILGTVNNA